MKFTEERLKIFALPLGETEEKRCKNAINMVRDALKGIGFSDQGKPIEKMVSDTYAYSLELRDSKENRKIKLFVQGSYANNTNVRTNSDVDIATVLETTFQTRYREGITDGAYGFTTTIPRTKTFKDEVEDALREKFGNDVERKNKSILINGNSYRVDADSVPCLRHRDYQQDFMNDSDNFVGGIFIRADNGETIINYPEQHIRNGKKKNIDTNHFYKKIVRIIKNIRYLMVEEHYSSAKKVSSFGLESLLWNIPNETFMKYSSYRFIFDEIIVYLYKNLDLLSNYKEANGIKALCPEYSFVENYKSFITDLKNYYDYDI